MTAITINDRKLKNFLKKFQGVQHNENNFQIGGGLTGGMSRRNFDAKLDEGKLTLDQAAKKISDIFGVAKALVVDIIENEFRLEWHHAGFLPKSYGGGMRKIYYVNSEQMISVVQNFESLVCKKKAQDEAEKVRQAELQAREQRKRDFVHQFGKSYTRVTAEPAHSVRTAQEMNGKHGWFDSKYKSYNLTEYFSGVYFESEELKQQYEQI